MSSDVVGASEAAQYQYGHVSSSSQQAAEFINTPESALDAEVGSNRISRGKPGAVGDDWNPCLNISPDTSSERHF